MKKAEKTEKILIVAGRDYTNRLSSFLDNFKHNGEKIKILAAAADEGARMQLKENPDIKLVLINDSMEDGDFELISNYIKKKLNTRIKIALMSSQPENIREQKIVEKYSFDGILDKRKLDDSVKTCIAAWLDEYESEVAKAPEISKNYRRDIEYLMGHGKVISDVLDLIEKYANTNKPMFIGGETGVGKELIVNYIHLLSGRKNIIRVNCGTLPKELATAALFGSVKGAYTDAHEDKKGLVEAANGGILFLDEFNSLPYDIQVNLLRVMEYKTFTKVGSTVEQKVNVRIIAAGNESFEELVEKGELRPDLRERFIKVIYVPTLDERIEDIDYFIDRFLSEENERQDKTASISSEARKLLVNHAWPRNIRQLKNIIETLVIEVEMDKKSKKYVILLQLVQTCFDEHRQNKKGNIPEDYTLQTATKTACDSATKTAILRALEKTGGNNTEAIILLDISHGKYYALKGELGIK